MKVNTNSWHYRFMALYKWSRKSGSRWVFEDSFLSWCRDNDIDWFGSKISKLDTYQNFKAYMTDTGMYQPIDFCSYWRNVLLYPAFFIAWWAVMIGYSVMALSSLSITGFLYSTATIILAIIALFIILVSSVAIDWVLDLIKNKRDARHNAKKNPGFFSNVGDALKHPEICTLMEYENGEEK